MTLEELIARADLTSAQDRAELADALEECGRLDEAAELRREDGYRPLVRAEGMVWRLLGVTVEPRRWWSGKGHSVCNARVRLAVRADGLTTILSLRAEMDTRGDFAAVRAAGALVRTLSGAGPALDASLRAWCAHRDVAFDLLSERVVPRKRDL